MAHSPCERVCAGWYSTGRGNSYMVVECSALCGVYVWCLQGAALPIPPPPGAAHAKPIGGLTAAIWQQLSMHPLSGTPVVHAMPATAVGDTFVR
jgi:hypothetical protein